MQIHDVSMFLSAALRDSQSGGCFNGMRDADTECLKRGCPYCYDDDEALYCSAKGDEHCRLILSNIAKQ